MRLEADWSEFEAEGARLRGYLARPAASTDPLPVAIVIQEAWGVDDHIRDVADRLASAGYLAFAPDLYSRDRPPELAPQRIEAAKASLDTLPPGAWGDERARAEALSSHPQGKAIGETLGSIFAGLQREHHVRDLEAAVAHVRGRKDAAAAVVSIGFCMGGGLSAQLAASGAGLAVAVCFYGMPPGREEAQRISCPLLGLYGGEDERITSQVPAFVETMRDLGKPFEHHIYEGAPHAFFNDTRPSYRVAAARDAWARTLALFAEHL
ncbi:MAG: dienelactone hydrolase family protein [Solirubrobacteraceae bacterium]|jgi:carboxymethylenebutenolidase